MGCSFSRFFSGPSLFEVEVYDPKTSENISAKEVVEEEEELAYKQAKLNQKLSSNQILAVNEELKDIELTFEGENKEKNNG
jgi:hypothetical protein